MEENRFRRRRPLNLYLRVHDRDQDRSLGRLMDISTEGLMILGEVPIRAGADYRLQIAFPTPVKTRKDLALDAQGIWCKEEGEFDLYASGLKLTRLTEEDAEIIRLLIHRAGFREDKPSLDKAGR